ncbi:MAG: hypothetical protein ACFCVB_04025 [Nodosilinea sp.]
MLAAEAEWQMLLVPSKPGSEKLGPEKLGPEPSGVSVLLAQDQPSPPALGGVARPEAGGGEVEMPEVEMPGGEMSGGEAIAPRAIDASDAVVAASGDIAVDGGLTDGGPIVPLAETLTQAPPQSSGVAPAERSEVFGQAAYLQQGGEGSARLRLGGIYVLSPSVFAGATVDLSTGQAFSDSDQTGLSLSELYLTASPANLPELRFTVGLMDLTSYLDRNSFAKDSLTHFFNPVFQTNPALSTVNVASRPGALVNWMPVDAVSLTATTFSANRSLGSFALDSFAGEVGVRFGNAIVRGTYVTSTDGGRGDGFAEIFSFDRGNGQFGPLPGDRETGYGLNAEAFIPGLNLGLFGRYGWYTNNTLGASGQTYSFGANGLDVFMPGDRLGLGYGRQLSNDGLRQASGGPVPDVWELFYDAQIVDNLRAGVTVQQRNAFTETFLGFRVRYDLSWYPLRRAAE